MTVRAVRGATQLDRDEREHLLERVAELVQAMLDHNELSTDELISIWFTATPDIHAEFPAYAARLIGLTDVPLMCGQEIDVAGAMPLVVRVLAHVQTERTRAELVHVYLHGAARLRRDLVHVDTTPELT